MRHLSALLGLLLCASCVGPQDTESNVKDLRVLAMRMDPPELLAEECSTDLAVLADTLVRPVRLTALIPDPAGDGRELDYTLWACASPDDDTCREDRVELARGVTKGGELVVDLFPGPGASRLADGTFLAQRILEEDLYNGLGGLRMPLVLWVRGGGEQVYAQKLMVYGCRFFPEMKPNVQPELPGLLLAGRAVAGGSAARADRPGALRDDPAGPRRARGGVRGALLRAEAVAVAGGVGGGLARLAGELLARADGRLGLRWRAGAAPGGVDASAERGGPGGALLDGGA